MIARWVAWIDNGQFLRMDTRPYIDISTRAFKEVVLKILTGNPDHIHIVPVHFNPDLRFWLMSRGFGDTIVSGNLQAQYLRDGSIVIQLTQTMKLKKNSTNSYKPCKDVILTFSLARSELDELEQKFYN